MRTYLSFGVYEGVDIRLIQMLLGLGRLEVVSPRQEGGGVVYLTVEPWFRVESLLKETKERRDLVPTVVQFSLNH